MESLQDLLGKTITDCPCGRKHEVPTKELFTSAGDLEARLVEVVDRLFPKGAVMLVCDDNTWKVAGAKALELLEAAGRDVFIFHADERNIPAHADSETVAELWDSVHFLDPAGLLAVGSGTINDISKVAASSAGKPQVTVATAASMNGYTSAIAALLKDGVKVTEPANPPAAVIADPEILATAPARMTAAGFGDLMSKNTSGADWMMSHALLDEYFCELPGHIVEDAVNDCLENASEIKKNSPRGLEILIDALLRSGISMVLAGSSSPASGGEHLISHLWDMTAHWNGRTPALHGEQTGIGTLVALALYGNLLKLTAADIRGMDAKPAFDSLQSMEAALSDSFRDLAPAVLPYARKKFLDAEALRERRKLVIKRWDAVRNNLSANMVAARECRENLQATGAPVNISDIGISEEELHFAYRNARWIRARYTVLDLAPEIGVLETWQDKVLSESGILGSH